MGAERDDQDERPVPPSPGRRTAVGEPVAVPHHKRLVDRGLEVAEDVVYVGVGLLLVVAALVSLGDAAFTFVRMGDSEGVQATVLEVLDLLLLVFIVVELLFAVRATILRRELVAEPFLLVGIIASIKEIVVLSVKAADATGTGAKFDDQMTEIGVLGVLVLLLAISAFLLRRKEREPSEGANSGHGGRAEEKHQPTDDDGD